MKLKKWVVILNFVAAVRRFVPYGVLKNIMCKIEESLEKHMYKISQKMSEGNKNG